MVFFDFLSKPITMSTDKVSVLCIENHRIYRKTVFITDVLMNHQ